MNQNQVTASLAIVAVSNGTTVNGYVRVDNGPLIQAWTKGSDKYTPDFEALAEDKRPIVIVVLRDVSSGRILIPSRLVFKYNGTVCRHVQTRNRIQCKCRLAVLSHDGTSRHEEPRAHLRI
mgnify:CR=1 FL=1